jgi:hypothetical protein
MPIAGLAASGIPSTALVEGRGATITGIVKRAYPTASDQRLALVPRTGDDIQLGAEPRGSGSPPDGETPPPAAGESLSPWATDPADAPWLSGDPGQPGTSTDPATAGGGTSSEVVNTTVDGLPALVGTRVRVGGRVEVPEVSGFALVDATGQVAVRVLAPGAVAALALHPDEIVNVVGWASRADAGDLEIVVVDPRDIVRGPRISDGSAAGSSPYPDPTPLAGLAAPEGPTPAGPTGPPIALIAVLLATLAALGGLGGFGYRQWKRQRA